MAGSAWWQLWLVFGIGVHGSQNLDEKSELITLNPHPYSDPPPPIWPQLLEIP